MSAEGIYPRSKVFREHRDVIEGEANRLYEDFVHPANFETYVRGMFSLDEDGFALLTGEDKEDIKNFARHAFSRLTASSASSPRHQNLLEDGRVVEAANEGAFEGGHDLLHAAVAYARNAGKSLVPAFAKARDDRELYTGAEQDGEEIFVALFENFIGQMSFVPYFAKGGDPFLNFRDWYRGYNIPETQKRLREHLEFVDSDPAEYLARMFEEVDVAARGEGLNGGRSYMRETKDPAYYHFLKTICDDARSDAHDPLVRVKEFQHLIQPLLQRLRRENVAHPDSKSAQE